MNKRKRGGYSAMVVMGNNLIPQSSKSKLS